MQPNDECTWAELIRVANASGVCKFEFELLRYLGMVADRELTSTVAVSHVKECTDLAHDMLNDFFAGGPFHEGVKSREELRQTFQDRFAIMSSCYVMQEAPDVEMQEVYHFHFEDRSVLGNLSDELCTALADVSYASVRLLEEEIESAITSACKGIDQASDWFYDSWSRCLVRAQDGSLKLTLAFVGGRGGLPFPSARKVFSTASKKHAANSAGSAIGGEVLQFLVRAACVSVSVSCRGVSEQVKQRVQCHLERALLADGFAVVQNVEQTKVHACDDCGAVVVVGVMAFPKQFLCHPCLVKLRSTQKRENKQRSSPAKLSRCSSSPAKLGACGSANNDLADKEMQGQVTSDK